MPSARMQQPVPGTISGTTPCTGISGAVPGALRCLPQAQAEWVCVMSLMCRIPVYVVDREMSSRGEYPNRRRSLSGKCWKSHTMQMPKCLLQSKSIRLPASRRGCIGGITEGISSTALRIPSFRSMMNSTSERPSVRLPLPASPTVFRCAVDWSRSCTGRTSPRY